MSSVIHGNHLFILLQKTEIYLPKRGNVSWKISSKSSNDFIWSLLNRYRDFPRCDPLAIYVLRFSPKFITRIKFCSLSAEAGVQAQFPGRIAASIVRRRKRIKNRIANIETGLNLCRFRGRMREPRIGWIYVVLRETVFIILLVR